MLYVPNSRARLTDWDVRDVSITVTYVVAA